MDADVPQIIFDEKGVCNYCKVHDQMEAEYPTGERGRAILEAKIKEIKEAGRGKAFDIIIGVSGGCDSTYMCKLAKEYGLRVLAAHFDNTWNSAIATQNIYTTLKKLDIELFTIVVNNEEYDEMLRAFLLSGTPDIDCPTDIGLAATMYMAAEKYGVKYQWDGHSFRTEGSAPLGFVYMDQMYIKSVLEQHSRSRKARFESYPTLWLSQQMKWWLFTRIQKVRPLYWVDYHKEKVKKELAETLGWKWYGGHHLENRYTAFLHTYYYPRRYGRDIRVIADSARVRSGQLSREEGLAILDEPLHADPQTVQMIQKRLGFNDRELEALVAAPHKTFRDYKTYKKTFETLRPFFFVLQKFDLISRSFYVKYTSKSEI